MRQQRQNQAFALYMNNLAPSARSPVRSMLKTSLHQLGGSTCDPQYFAWQRLDVQQVMNMRNALVVRGYAVNSVNLALCGMKGVAKVAFQMEKMDADRYMRIQAVKKTKGDALRTGRCLERSDIRKMVSVTARMPITRRKRDKALLMTGCGAGLRCAELLNLQIEDYDAKTGTLSVVHGKGSKNRQVMLAPNVKRALDGWIKCIRERIGPVFRRINKSGKISDCQLSSEGVAVVLRTMQQMARIKSFTPHDMRRTFITRLLQQGYDLNIVRQLAGHADVSMTAKYDKRHARVLVNASRSLQL